MNLKDIFLGSTRLGDRIYIDTLIYDSAREVVTTNHEVLPSVRVVSICGERKSKHRRLLGAGQILDDLPYITKPSAPFTLEDIAYIHEFWKRWHLNDLNSHCAHQDKSIAWDKVAPCPETGYKAGSAWLTEVIPTEITTQFENFIREKVGA